MTFGVGHARVGAQEVEVLAADHSVETCNNGIVHIEMLTSQFGVVHHVLSGTLTGFASIAVAQMVQAHTGCV